MKEESFEELLESVRQGGAILRGEAAPERAWEVPMRGGVPDVAAIREHFGMSQPRFAELMGISVGTLRNWEQGRRTPEGPASILLEVAARYPDVVWGVVRERRARWGVSPEAESKDGKEDSEE